MISVSNLGPCDVVCGMTSTQRTSHTYMLACHVPTNTGQCWICVIMYSVILWFCSVRGINCQWSAYYIYSMFILWLILCFIVVQDEKQQLMRATVWMRLVSNYDYGLLLIYYNLSENTKRALEHWSSLLIYRKFPMMHIRCFWLAVLTSVICAASWLDNTE